VDEDVAAKGFMNERQRAARALALGALLGAILALVGRRRVARPGR
jgi:hypothetical protein